MTSRNKRFTVISMALALCVVFTSGAFGSMMKVNGVNGDYATMHYYIDESEGHTESVSIEFWPYEGNVTQVELWSNLNKRDMATLYPDPPENVTAGDPNHYWCAYTMADEGGGRYTISLPIEKCGTYRITCRYKVDGDPNWRWYSGRNTAIVVSDTTCRDMIVYELQVNAVDATGNDWNSRSHFDSLHDGWRFNLDYVKALGVNTLWLMPFHPIGSKSDGNHGALGSPYSIKNMWKVGEHLGSDGTRDDAMYDFQQFMSAAESAGVNVIFDTIFNHTAKDAEIERNPDNPTQLAADPLAEIRYVRPSWYSRYTGDGSCYWDSDWGGSPPYEYWYPAENAGQLGPAPADRHDFGKWCDTSDLFWGSYSALGNPRNEDDSAWNMSTEVAKMTEYFTYFVEYWLNQTSYTLDGFRCDFAQGLPPQAWEYMINKSKSLKPELMFLAESLDGGPVTYRAGRHFDVLNDDWVWSVLGNGVYTTGLRSVIDQRRAVYGFAGILRGLVNHDEPAPSDKWYTAARYAVGCAIDGAPQMFMGQELGYQREYGFSNFRWAFGKPVPNIREFYNMEALWNDTAPDHDALWNVYAHANKARQNSVAIRLANQYYLNRTNFEGAHENIFSVMKYTNYGWDVADQEVVLCFVNLQPGTGHFGTFYVNEPPIYLDPAKTYNIRNLASANPDAYLWPEDKTGSDIANNGIYIAFSSNVGDPGAVVQFLKLEVTSGSPPPDDLWIGNNYVFPSGSDLDYWEDFWVNVQTWPIAPGQTVKVGYKSSHDNIWVVKEMAWDFNGDNNSHWHLNLGNFPKGATIEYYFEAFNGSATEWDNNSGGNYFITVSQNEPAQNPGEQPSWVGNDKVLASPPTDDQDLIVEVESYPIADNQWADIVFCYGDCDNPDNWSSDRMYWVKHQDNNSFWQYNFGQLPSGTTLEWNMNVNGGGTSVWAFAAGDNAEATIVSGSDRDGDGIPNDVETEWGLNPDNEDDAQLDKDLDGMSNLDEHRTGTDATQYDSVMAVTNLTWQGSDSVKLEWQGQPSITYIIDRCTEGPGGTFSNLTTRSTVGLTPYTMELTDTLPGIDNALYRLRVE